MTVLHNKVSRQLLRERLMKEDFRRVTLSFYRYFYVDDVQALRDALYMKWSALGCLGRIYVAREGINAQMSVPEHEMEAFTAHLHAVDGLQQVPLKIAVEDDGRSFIKLNVKIRAKLVADGLADGSFDVTNVGTHLTAEEFNQAMDLPGAVVVDMRNHYESEVGRFEGAVCPDADTFRDELPMVAKILEGKEEQPVLLYCTGGIRCEKASAYLRHKGFSQVHQLHGGIIDYVRQVRTQNLTNRFLGKNFVFDDRMGERISEHILAACHQCGQACDEHVNCANTACHHLFIQCSACRAALSGCCSAECQAILEAHQAGQAEQGGQAMHDGRAEPGGQAEQAGQAMHDGRAESGGQADQGGQAEPGGQAEQAMHDGQAEQAKPGPSNQPSSVAQPKVYRKGRPPGRTEAAAPHAVHPA